MPHIAVPLRKGPFATIHLLANFEFSLKNNFTILIFNSLVWFVLYLQTLFVCFVFTKIICITHIFEINSRHILVEAEKLELLKSPSTTPLSLWQPVTVTDINVWWMQIRMT